MPIDQTDSGKGKFPLHWFAAAFVISLLTSVFGGWQMWQVHERFQELSDMRAHVTEDIGRIMLFDEILTMSARMAAATGEFAYETRYDQIDAQLTAVINHVKADLPQVDVARHIAATDAANLALVKLERQAFALMHQGKLQQASALLASTEYLGLKKEYAGGMKKTAAAMMAFIAGKQQRLHTQAELIAATNFGGVLVLLATWFFAIRSARSWATAQREFDEALKKSHDELEVLVKQRTAELSSANEQLQHEISEHKILFDSSHDALMLLAPPSWKFTGANKATLQLFGAASMADFTALGPWDVSPERQPDGRLSSEKAQEMIATAMRVGACFFEWVHQRLDGQPFISDVLLTRMQDGDTFLQATVRDISERKRMEQENLEAGIRLKAALEDAIGAMAATLEQRDPYTAGHQRRVAELAAAIAAEMGLAGEVIEGIHFGGLIHDIGKISVPAEILGKPGRLSDIEFGLIKTHAEDGYEILKNIAFPCPVVEMVRQHHERLDGTGYPQGLAGEQIILEARILAVADIVEAMSANRPYRPGLGMEAALDEITRQRGSGLDPLAVDACLRVIREQGFAFAR